MAIDTSIYMYMYIYMYLLCWTDWFEDPFLFAVLSSLPLSLQETEVVREDEGQWNKVDVLCVMKQTTCVYA